MGTDHTSKQFDNDLETLRSQVLQMGGLVEAQVRDAIQAFSNGNISLADQIVETELRVDRFEIDIDSDCSQIIVRRQPAAADLRLIMAVTKTVTDLERIGDEAHKIARMVKQIHERGVADLSRFANLRHTADAAVNMLRQSLDAFARLDVKVAEQTILEDRVIDLEFKAVVRQLITFMMEDPRIISTALDIIWIAKAIERIGDHAKNICEDVIYIVHGTDVRHAKSGASEAENTLAKA